MLIGKIKELLKPAGLVCPRCERPMEDHDSEFCARRMSRRFFLGAGLGVVGAAAITNLLPNLEAAPAVLIGFWWRLVGPMDQATQEVARLALKQTRFVSATIGHGDATVFVEADPGGRLTIVKRPTPTQKPRGFTFG